MPPALVSGLVSIGVGLIFLLIAKFTLKSSAEVAQELQKLRDAVAQLQKDGWSTDDRVALGEKLARHDILLTAIRAEVDFTKTSHQEFLRLLERALIPVAHSPHTPELDRLLEKRDRGEQLTVAEWEDLIRRLGEQAQFYDDTPGKKIALAGLRAIYLTQLRQAQRREASI